DHRDGELGLQPDVVDRTDLAQECERLRVAAEENVLSVVDGLARVAIGKRGCPSAEPRLGLDDHDARAVAREPRCRAQSREASADADDVYVHSHGLSAMSACRGRAMRARTVNTS